MEDVKKRRIAGVNSRPEFIFCLPNWRHDQRLRFGNLEIIGPLDFSLTNANWQDCLIEGKPKKGWWSIRWHFRGILRIKKWFARAPNDLVEPELQESLQHDAFFIPNFTDNIILFPTKEGFMKKNIFLAYKSDKLISIERLFGIMPSVNIECLKD